MKKHVFSLLMMFALVMGLSTGAWAQTALPATAAAATVGSPTNPKVFLNGGTGMVQLTRGVPGSTVVWNLYKGTTPTTLATETSTPAAVGTTQDLDISGSGSTWHVTQTNVLAEAAEFRFKWTDVAEGNYYLEATETEVAVGRTCAETKRGYHIFIFGFDVAVYASNDLGDSLTASEVLDCGDDDYNVFMNDVQMAIDGTTLRTDLFNSGTTPIPTNGTLGAAYGNQKTRRYYTAEIRFKTPGSGIFTPASLTLGSATMDIAITGTDVTAKDVMNINNQLTDLAEDDATIVTGTDLTLVVKQGAVGVNKFTFPVDFADRWNVDLKPVATVTNLILYTAADGSGVALGEEPGAYEDTAPIAGYDGDANRYDNTSNAYTIYGKPATSPITE